MKPVPLLHRFSFKVIAGLIGMLFLVGIPFFVLFLRFHRDQILETIENSTTAVSRVLTRELEMSVLLGRHHLLEPVVQSLPSAGGVRSILIIDAEERVAFSSDPAQLGRKLDRMTAPGCRECHMNAVMKSTMHLTDDQGISYYRNVNVIQNRPACYACHDATSTVNGILIMDFSQDELRGQFQSSVAPLMALGAAMLVLTIAVLYVLLNQLVIRKLKVFSEAADRIGTARFGRLELAGNDEFAQLASSFNVMSERLGTAMKVIQSSKEYLEDVLNNIDDEVIVVDRSFQIVTANAAYFRNRRHARRLIQEDECASWSDEAAAESRPADISCASARTFDDGRIHKILQTYIDPAGKERFVEAYSSPLRNENNEVYQVIEVRRDITERKLLEANLAHSERLVSMGLLASGLAHEINNPLASISTFVEGLRRRMERRGETDNGALDNLESSMQLIQKEIERAKEVTARLLILAQRGDSGRTLVDLRQSLEETLSLVQYEAGKRGIALELDSQSGLPTLRIPESQIRQVFLNLLLNSLQAGHAGGFVRCRIWTADDSIFASVTDDGSGIAPADLLQIFEPFFSKKGPGQGTGLGLFICKSIVSTLGGDIQVESTPGQGARFTVRLPVHAGA